MIKLLIDDFKYYNANSKDNDTSDCVIRSLSLAYNMDYNKVGNELRKIRRDGNYRQWNILPVYKQFIEKYGLVRYEVIEEDLTVEQFSEKYSTGIYLILCGKNVMKSTHIVCIIDGTIYDSWDCSKWSANKVFIVSEDATNIDDNIDNTIELKDYAIESIKNSVDRYNLSYGKLEIDEEDSIINKYDIHIYCEYNVEDLGLSDNTKYFNFNYLFKFSPRYTTEQSKSIIDNITNNYTKKYISNMVNHIKDVKDNEELHSQYSDEFRGSYEAHKLRNKLPYWCRKLITDIEIDNHRPENRYSDKYAVYMQALPDDPRRDRAPEVGFYADSLPDLIRDINDYKKDYSRFGYDY